MSRLIDRSNLKMEIKKWLKPNVADESTMVALDDIAVSVLMTIEEQPLVNAIPLDKVKKAIAQIIDEKDFAYADFERYKEEVLNVESDELPDDDFRYGMERCLEILDKLIAESEEK